MTPDDFRRLALGLPETTEQSHMGHPDFRVRGKVFASLGWPDAAWAVVKLSPEEQESRVTTEPDVFEPVPGTWGRRGSTKVRLAAADEATLHSALVAAWRGVAPKKVVALWSAACSG